MQVDTELVKAKPTAHQIDINYIAGECYRLLTHARAATPKCGPVTFKGEDLATVPNIFGYVYYTDRESLGAIIARIHEMTGPQVVCETANSWGVPFDFMHNCIKCRFT